MNNLQVIEREGMKDVKQQLNQINNNALEVKKGVREIKKESSLFVIEMDELQKAILAIEIENSNKNEIDRAIEYFQNLKRQKVLKNNEV